MLKGIDVSDVQKTIDWDKAKAAGLNFAMLKCGYGEDRTDQDEDYFARNVSECERLGIPWGAYLYSYAMKVSDAPSEVQHALRALRGHKPPYPVIIDMEDADGYKARNGGIPPAQTVTDILKAELGALESAGYYAGWYANKDWCINHLCPDQLAHWTFWYARPGVEAPDRSCGMWQYQIGETGGKWPGVNGLCDLDISYNDYPSIIKSTGKSGATKATAERETSSSCIGVNAYYRVRVGGVWLPEVCNLTDFAGRSNGNPITDVAVRVSVGSVKYRVHVKGGSWLPYVTGCNINDSNNGYAGNGKPVDAIEVYYFTPSSIRPFKRAKYRVAPESGNYYPWQYDDETGNGQDGYAGTFGKTIDRLQMCVE